MSKKIFNKFHRELGIANLIILIVIVVVGIAGFILFSKQKASIKPENNNVASPAISETPDNEIADWQTYTDPDSIYSFKYPIDMVQRDYAEGDYKGISLTLIGPTQKASGRTQTELAEGAMIKTILMPDTNADEESESLHEKETNVPEGDVVPSITPISEITVDGTKAYQYTQEGVTVTFIQVGNDTLRFTEYYAGFSSEEMEQYKNLTGKILSTFKFMNNKISSECGVCGARGLHNIEGKECAQGLECKSSDGEVAVSGSFCVKPGESIEKCLDSSQP